MAFDYDYENYNAGERIRVTRLSVLNHMSSVVHMIWCHENLYGVVYKLLEVSVFLSVFTCILMINNLIISCEIAAWWMPQVFIDDMSTLVQVNVLEPPGNKPWHETILTKITIAIYHLQATVS